MNRIVLAAVLLLVSSPGIASNAPSAADRGIKEILPDSTVIYRVNPIVVEAPRPVTTVGGAAAVEASVDSLRVPAAPTLEAVLREIPLLHVRTNSRGEAEISARGSESRQVAVLVDGVPITLAWDARADISIIPAEAIQDVVYVRGLSSMLHGPNVLGGVVETRIGRSFAQPEETACRVRLGADDVGAYSTTLATAIPMESRRGQSLLRAGLAFRHTPGDPLADDIVEPVSTDDGLRLNTDAENVSGFLALRQVTKGGAWLSLSGTSFRAHRGIAAELGVPDEDARLWRYPRISRTLAILSGGTGQRSSPVGGRGSLEGGFGWDRGRTDIDSYTSRAYQEIGSFEDGKDRTLTGRLLASQTLGGRGDLRAALTLADIRHDEIIPDGTFRYRQRLWSIGMENSWRLVESAGALNSLALTLGGARDVGETPEAGGRELQPELDEWGGRLGLSALMKEGRVVLHAGVSRRARFPALRELYSGALKRFAPNPDLKPEDLVTGEAGITSRLPGGELQVVGFHNRLKDAVVRITLPDKRFMRVNRNRLESTGLELLGTWSRGPVVLSASATFQDVRLTDTSADETHQPENLPERFGDVNLRFPVAAGITGWTDVAYTGSQYGIDPATGEDAKLDAAALIGAGLSRAWPLRISWGGGSFARLEARVGVENAGDAALYDACGLPEPGRRFRFELRMD